MKCYINHIIENNDEKQEKINLPAIYIKDESLKFKCDDEKIIIRLKKDNIIMEKDSKESNIIFDFKLNKKTESKYLMKNINFYLDTEVLTNKLEIKDNYIYIEYEVWLSNEYAGIFKYQIDIKEE
jgi:uncharacterized beta-barrel protein YwiB (DUF1934 family)